MMKTPVEMLYSRLEESGLKGRVVPVQHLADLKAEIETRHSEGLFNEEFHNETLSFFSFRPPDDLPSAASLIVVATARHQNKASFTWNGKIVTLILPPTYLGYYETPRQIGERLKEWLSPLGYAVASARLPLKPLAAHSGLAKYGRNNITYIAGMGSFFQLAAFFSDLPCQEDGWHEPTMIDRCQKCRVCLNQCHSRAITSERFLLRAERCLTFHNERSPDHPFPTWIDQAWHHCVIGCMDCQEFCPENRAFRKCFDVEETFTHEETSLLLRGTSPDQLPSSSKAKLERLDLLGYLKLLPRNLSVFFEEAH